MFHPLPTAFPHPAAAHPCINPESPLEDMGVLRLSQGIEHRYRSYMLPSVQLGVDGLLAGMWTNAWPAGERNHPGLDDRAKGKCGEGSCTPLTDPAYGEFCGDA